MVAFQVGWGAFLLGVKAEGANSGREEEPWRTENGLGRKELTPAQGCQWPQKSARLSHLVSQNTVPAWERTQHFLSG